MKKVIYTLLVILGATGYSQVIIGDETTIESNSLGQEDLDIQGNLKIETLESLCNKDNNNIICPSYSQTFLDVENNNTMVKGNIPKIFQRLVFYVKVGNKDDKVYRFDTKINSKKYAAILSGSSILDSSGNLLLIPEITNGLNATKHVSLFEYSKDRNNPENTTWAFSANYTSNITNSPIWRIEMLLMDKSYVADINTANPDNIYSADATGIERHEVEGFVGIGENNPQANLDIKGNLRIQQVRDVTKDESLKNNTLPMVVDVSTKDGQKTNHWGLLKATGNTKVAYPINLHINMNGNDKDFLYYLRLGLDPQKYTPILANYQLNCRDTNVNWGISFSDGKQPTPNNFITKFGKGNGTYENGMEDWALYLDFNLGRPSGCNSTYWDAFLLVFRNENLISVPVNNGDNENAVNNPFDIARAYDSDNKGYVGGVKESPLQ